MRSTASPTNPDRLARGLRQRDRELLDAMVAVATGYRDALDVANPTDPNVMVVMVCFCPA